MSREALDAYLAAGGTVTKCAPRTARGAEVQRPTKANIRFGRARTRSFRMRPWGKS